MEGYIFLGILIGIFAIINARLNKKVKDTEKAAEEKEKQLKENTLDEEQIQEEAEKQEKFPYILAENVLSSKEQKFYNSIKPIADRYNLTILCKMRLADIVKVPKDTYESLRWFNYIKAKHIDFILCDNDFKIKLLIEVDDYTHNYQNRKNRDEFVDKIFQQLNLKLAHFKTWTDEELENEIKNVFSLDKTHTM